MTHQQHAHLQTHSQPSSPLSTKFKHYVSHIGIDPTHVIPLEDPIRTTPIHPSISSIRIPTTTTTTTSFFPSSSTNPSVTNQTTDDRNSNNNNYSNEKSKDVADIDADAGRALALNPLTLKPFTSDDLKHHNYHALRTQYAHSPESAARARDEAIAEIRARLDEADRRTREVEREMEEKEKTREIERKVWAKRRGGGGAGGAGASVGVGDAGNGSGVGNGGGMSG